MILSGPSKPLSEFPWSHSYLLERRNRAINCFALTLLSKYTTPHNLISIKNFGYLVGDSHVGESICHSKKLCLLNITPPYQNSDMVHAIRCLFSEWERRQSANEKYYKVGAIFSYFKIFGGAPK